MPRAGNANGARAKLRSPASVPVTAGLVRCYSDYMHTEYGNIDSDYVFVNLWSGRIGAPMTYATVHQLMGRIRARTGVEFTPHGSGSSGAVAPARGRGGRRRQPGGAVRWSPLATDAERARDCRAHDPCTGLSWPSPARSSSWWGSSCSPPPHRPGRRGLSLRRVDHRRRGQVVAGASRTRAPGAAPATETLAVGAPRRLRRPLGRSGAGQGPAGVVAPGRRRAPGRLGGDRRGGGVAHPRRPSGGKFAGCLMAADGLRGRLGGSNDLGVPVRKRVCPSASWVCEAGIHLTHGRF